MKKLAIITFHETNNFGALFQTFGLYKKLNDLGYDCSILDYQCANMIKMGEVPQPFHFSLNPKTLAIEYFYKRHRRRKHQAMLDFSHEYMSKMTKRYDINTVKNIEEKFDAFIVGSDMLWGLDMTGHDYSYFLDFVPKGVRKLSYAPSFGADWNDEEKVKIKSLLADFSFISVRENITADRLEKMIGKRPDVVCDPTMLLTPDEWKHYVSDKYAHEKYVLVYFITDDEKTVEDAKRYAKARGLKVYYVYGNLKQWQCKLVTPYRPEDFLSLIYYADTVFTASFHGLSFALYFNKNFFYYCRKPAQRSQQLAAIAGCESREGTNMTSVDFDNAPALDFKSINKRMEDYRNSSIKKIIFALDDNQANND